MYLVCYIEKHKIKHKSFTRETVADSYGSLKKFPSLICKFELLRFHQSLMTIRNTFKQLSENAIRNNFNFHTCDGRPHNFLCKDFTDKKVNICYFYGIVCIPCLEKLWKVCGDLIFHQNVGTLFHFYQRLIMLGKRLMLFVNSLQNFLNTGALHDMG